MRIGPFTHERWNVHVCALDYTLMRVGKFCTCVLALYACTLDCSRRRVGLCIHAHWKILHWTVRPCALVFLHMRIALPISLSPCVSSSSITLLPLPLSLLSVITFRTCTLDCSRKCVGKFAQKRWSFCPCALVYHCPCSPCVSLLSISPSLVAFPHYPCSPSHLFAHACWFVHACALKFLRMRVGLCAHASWCLCAHNCVLDCLI